MKTQDLVKETLKQRGEEYGSYEKLSRVLEEMKALLRKRYNWSQMPPYVRLSIEMILLKVVRACNATDKKDSFLDIAGYATLALEQLEAKEKAYQKANNPNLDSEVTNENL